jgi:hypothetical protein
VIPVFGENSLVHIGYHKTATNWFQRRYYPGIENAHYVHRKRVRQALLSDSAFHFDVRRARQALNAPEGKRLILCEEELSGNIHNGGLFGCLSKEAACRIRDLLPGASVVIFIRNQVDMIASVYNQYVKEGGTHRPRRYLFHERYLSDSGFASRYAPLFSFDHFEYLPLIRHYQRLFGTDRVHVYAFETFRADISGFMRAYEATHGLQAQWPQVKEDRVNLSYKLPVLYLARLLNRFTYQDVIDKRFCFSIPGFYKQRRNVLNAVNRLGFIGGTPGPAAVLGRDVVDYIQQRYAASNRDIVRLLDLPLGQYGYPL